MTTYNIWFEGEPLPAYVPYMDENINIIGPGSATPDDKLKHVREAKALIIGGLKCDAELYKRTPDLLVVTRTGIGYDTVNVSDSTEAGIAVVNTPDGPTLSTAECALGLIIGASRRHRQIDLKMRDALKNGERHSYYREYEAYELWGKQLGLVGLGRIGGHVAKVCKAMGMNVAAYDPYVSAEKAAEMGVQLVDKLEDLLGMADVVSIHLPLNDETYKFMNRERFAQMKDGAVFVNTARGGHVDEEALLEVVESGKLFGVGLDVTDPEPPKADNPLLQYENVIITPHIASATYAGKFRIYKMAVEYTLMVLRGERPPALINPEVWDRVREKWESQQAN